MRSIPFLLFCLSCATAGAADDVQLRDPDFYPVLAKGDRMECHYLLGLSDYGLILERGQSDKVHVTLINAGVSEGEKTAFDATIKSATLKSVYMLFHKREGDAATNIEIIVETRTSADVGYQLPGHMMSTSALYSRGEDGKEKEDLYADGSHRMACKPPVLAKRVAIE